LLTFNGNVFHVPSPSGKGEKVADRPDEVSMGESIKTTLHTITAGMVFRFLTHAGYVPGGCPGVNRMNQKRVDSFPLTLALSPVENA